MFLLEFNIMKIINEIHHDKIDLEMVVGGATIVSKSEKKKKNLELDLITRAPLPLFSQALWRDKSSPRHSCTMESTDDPLTDSQNPPTNTTTNTAAPTQTLVPQSQDTTQAATDHHEPHRGRKVQQNTAIQTFQQMFLQGN